MIYYHVYYKNLGLQVSLMTQPAFLYNWAQNQRDSSQPSAIPVPK